MTRAPREISINDSPFLKSLLKRSQKLYLTKGNKVRHKFNQKDTYQRGVIEICLRISALLETLRLSRFFIDERRNIAANNNFKITNSDFIRYHLECYFIRITTFKDLMYKLYNRVYKLELRENIGLQNNLKKRAEKDNIIELINLLDGLSILMTSVEPIRNKIAHGGYHDDIDLILLEGKDIIKDRKKNSALENDNYDKVMNQLLTKNILDMHMIEIMMATFILLSYKNLYPIRKSKEKDLL